MAQNPTLIGGGVSPLKEWLTDALQRPHTQAYRVTVRITFVLILVSVLTVIVETAPTIYAPLAPMIDALELVILAAFTAEYVANVYVAENRRKYVLGWWGIIDLLAILPGFLTLFQFRGLTFLRELRVLRVLRMLKLMKIAADRRTQSAAQASHRRTSLGLDMQIYAICFFTVVVISSTLVYHAERDLADTAFTSIPAAIWWSLVTVTTTGYGDYIPQSLVGRIFAAATMLAGLALFSLLTSVVGRALLVSLFGTSPDGADSDGGALSGDAEVVAPPDGSALGRLVHAAFADPGSALYSRVQAFITALIFGSVSLVVLESVPSIYVPYEALFHVVDTFVVGVFTLEYAAYIYLATSKRRYVFSFWGLVDLLAVLPSYLAVLAFLFPLNLTAIKIVRMLRVLRILRTLKLTKVASGRTVKSSVDRPKSTFALDLQIYFNVLFTAVVISSALVYFAELDVPDSKFVHIPAAMWWSIVTITTTGYGDMVPATFIGRAIAGLTMVTGLALFGILTSVIGRAMLSSLFGTQEGPADDPDPPTDGPGAGDGPESDQELIARLTRENQELRAERDRQRSVANG